MLRGATADFIRHVPDPAMFGLEESQLTNDVSDATVACQDEQRTKSRVQRSRVCRSERQSDANEQGPAACSMPHPPLFGPSVNVRLAPCLPDVVRKRPAGILSRSVFRNKNVVCSEQDELLDRADVIQWNDHREHGHYQLCRLNAKIRNRPMRHQGGTYLLRLRLRFASAAFLRRSRFNSLSSRGSSV
jgi:hypothetical protein